MNIAKHNIETMRRLKGIRCRREVNVSIKDMADVMFFRGSDSSTHKLFRASVNQLEHTGKSPYCNVKQYQNALLRVVANRRDDKIKSNKYVMNTLTGMER